MIFFKFIAKPQNVIFFTCHLKLHFSGSKRKKISRGIMVMAVVLIVGDKKKIVFLCIKLVIN
jgi:hypothetical protein